MPGSKKRARPEPSANADQQKQGTTFALGKAAPASTTPSGKKKKAPPPPASNELDLEKLIFGGGSNLLSQPSSSNALVTGVEENGGHEEEDFDLEAEQDRVADDDLFMVDTGAREGEDAEPDQLFDGTSADGAEGSDGEDDEILIGMPSGSGNGNLEQSVVAKRPKRSKKCVWSDPDDAKLTVSLTGRQVMGADGGKIGATRLRKLREEVGEDKINGLEYEMRLRAQFEKMHPRPVWTSLRLFSRSEEASSQSEEAAWISTDEAGTKSINALLRSDSGLIEGYESRSDKTPGHSIKARGKLKAGEIEVDRLRNANDSQTSQAIVAEEDLPGIEMIQFHPNPRASVLMTASKDRRVRLFQIDGKSNPLLQTVHVPDLPVQHASFHPSGSSVLIAGNRPFLFAYDLQAGRVIRSQPWRGSGSLQSQSSADDGAERSLSNAKFQPRTAEEGNRLLAIGGRRGMVHLLDWGRSGASGGTRIGGVRMNATLAGFTWDAASVLGDRGTGIGVTGTGKDVELLTMSTEGSIHLWDIRNTGAEVGCVSIWNDSGSYGAKGLEVSPNGRFWSVGSKSGIVNIYKRPAESYGVSSDSLQAVGSAEAISTNFGQIPGGSISPIKNIENLVTDISTMRWNGDGQILALASKAKKDALRLVHFPSMRVFSNWPTSGTPLGSVTSVDFSPSSQYLAIGNTRGKVLLYSLRHYL